MLRYVLLILFLLAVAPLVPRYMDGFFPNSDDTENLSVAITEEEDAGTGSRRFEIPRAANGQYLTEARLNGRDVTMLVDTGASQIALPEDLARRIGIFPKPADYTRLVHTANGTTKAALETLRELRLGPIRLKNVDVLVLEEGLLSVPLLGMSALGRLESFNISGDTLILIQ